MASVAASVAATYLGISCVVGIVDVIIKTFGLAKTFLQASRRVADAIVRIVDVCENVKELLNDNKAFAFPKSIIDSVERTLMVVRDIAEKYKNQTLGGRIRHMPKALDRLNELDKVEKQLQTVLTLIAANVAGEAFANTERTVEILGEQQDSLNQVLVSIDTTSTRIETAILDVEKICGPLADLALDDKVEEILQRFDRIDERLRCLDSGMEIMLPTMESIREDTRAIKSRLSVPAETTRQDIWVCNFSSVPSPPSYVVETQYVRNLYSALLDETGRCRVFTVHGWGGAGKTTACKMIANNANVRQRFKDGIVWIELGETASSGALIEGLARAVKRSGGENASEYILRHMDAGKFELAKDEFQNWFDDRDVLFVLDNIWDSKDRDFNRWIDVVQEIPGRKSSLLCSSRTALGEKNIRFTQVSKEEQAKLFLSHLQLQQDSREYQDNMELAQTIIEDCAGLPLALAMAAGYLRRDPSGWKSLSDRIRKEITVEGKRMFRISQHSGLASVFQTSLAWLGREIEPPQNCSLSWAELYTSLCVMDRASPGLPLCVLSLMWRFCTESALEVCQTFVSLSLATLSAGDMENRTVKLHDLQLQYCREQCAGTRTPSHNSARSLVPECIWHVRIIEGLLAEAAAHMVSDDSAEGGHKTASTGFQAGTARADAVVEAFMGLVDDSPLEKYFRKNLLRHICECEEGLLLLARGVLSDYRWLYAVCSRQSLRFAASQYYAVISRVRERRANIERSIATGEGTDLLLAFIRDLESIADILRFLVPPEAMILQDNNEETPCPVHGKRSVGDPGLAHQLVGRLRFVSSEYSSVVLGAGGGNGGGDDGGRRGVFSLVDMLVGSIKIYAFAPWLVPVNRGHFEADRRGLSQVIRGGANCCLSLVNGNAECVAFGGWKVISVYNLESGDLIRELHDEGAGWIESIAVAGEGCGVQPAEVGDDVDHYKVVWLAAGHGDGSVRIWDLETGRCVTTLHPMFGPEYSESSGVSVASNWSRVVHYVAPDLDNPAEAGGLHVWDLSSDGTQERYEYVHGCKNSLGFEVASAALLYQDSKSSVEQCSSRAVRFERCLNSNKKKKLHSYFGRSFPEGGPLGCLTSSEENELSETTDNMLLMRVAYNFFGALAESDVMRCSRVENCKGHVLVAAVNGDTKVITVLDALTSEIISEFITTDDDLFSVAAFQRDDGRVLVVTGGLNDGMIRMRMADSGELIGQWRALRGCVNDLAIAVKAGKVIGAYHRSGLWIWSFSSDRPGVQVQSNNPTIVDALSPSRPTEALNLAKHSKLISSIAFSEDGKVAASCSYGDKFVLVWDATTGTVVRQLDITEGQGRFVPLAVALSSSGDWILCASVTERDGKNGFVNLWGRPSNEEFSAHFKSDVKMRGCCVTINTTQDRVDGAILCGSEETGFKTYEWVHSRLSDPEIVVTPTAASDDVLSELKQIHQGSRELLLQVTSRQELHVRNAALDGVDFCTCKAAAVFDSWVHSYCAWIEPNAQDGAFARAAPKVAVGLTDGTVHFMQLRSERDDREVALG
jgi:WD40 repeat protein